MMHCRYRVASDTQNCITEKWLRIVAASVGLKLKYVSTLFSVNSNIILTENKIFALRVDVHTVRVRQNLLQRWPHIKYMEILNLKVSVVEIEDQ